jgi:phage repressor protein C with HTH and peptisase S24 domain
LTHDQIWEAIDRLAASRNLSPSGLARRAGLDPTAFNKSKRAAVGGRKRWPSTESLAKVLDAAGMTLEEFAELVAEVSRTSATKRRLPVTGSVRDGLVVFTNEQGAHAQSYVLVPSIEDERAFALDVADDSLQPLYRRGDVLVVSPAETARPGDRVIVQPASGPAQVRLLLPADRRGAMEFAAIAPGAPRMALARAQVTWIARIIWASQ